MRIEVEQLHRAADIVGKTEDADEILAGLGDALDGFIEESNWHEENPDGPGIELAPLSLAMGVSIGIVVAQHLREHEQNHVGGTG